MGVCTRVRAGIGEGLSNPLDMLETGGWTLGTGHRGEEKEGRGLSWALGGGQRRHQLRYRRFCLGV